MKKIIITITALALVAVAIGGVSRAFSHPSSRKLYENNRQAFIQYINDFTVPEKEGNLTIPDSLRNIGVEDIKFYDNAVFFLTKTEGFVFGGALYGIYYSFEDVYAKDTPYYCDIDENEAPVQTKENALLFGDKKNGEWYYTEKLDTSWYSFEVHSS